MTRVCGNELDAIQNHATNTMLGVTALIERTHAATQTIHTEGQDGGDNRPNTQAVGLALQNAGLDMQYAGDALEAHGAHMTDHGVVLEEEEGTP